MFSSYCRRWRAVGNAIDGHSHSSIPVEPQFPPRQCPLCLGHCFRFRVVEFNGRMCCLQNRGSIFTSCMREPRDVSTERHSRAKRFDSLNQIQTTRQRPTASDKTTHRILSPLPQAKAMEGTFCIALGGSVALIKLIIIFQHCRSVWQRFLLAFPLSFVLLVLFLFMILSRAFL